MQIQEEFKTIIKNDLKIGGEDDEKEDDDLDGGSSSSFEIIGGSPDKTCNDPNRMEKIEKQNKLLKTFGINVEVFYHTLFQLRETADRYEKEMTVQVGLFFTEIQ